MKTLKPNLKIKTINLSTALCATQDGLDTHEREFDLNGRKDIVPSMMKEAWQVWKRLHTGWKASLKLLLLVSAPPASSLLLIWSWPASKRFHFKGFFPCGDCILSI